MIKQAGVNLESSRRTYRYTKLGAISSGCRLSGQHLVSYSPYTVIQHNGMPSPEPWQAAHVIVLF